jgi:hypothetical protein
LPAFAQIEPVKLFVAFVETHGTLPSSIGHRGSVSISRTFS